MPDQQRARRNGVRDPWADAPTSELNDQVLPRWFVLTAIVMVILATVVAVLAFTQPQRNEVALEARRPPAANGYTNAVGAVSTGTADGAPYDAPCAQLDGVAVAGTDADRGRLRRGLAGLCNVALPEQVDDDLTALAAAGGTVRFATFEATGVDSTVRTDGDAPTVLINTRFSRTDASFISPLIAHDATMLAGDPSTAETALAARRAEAAVCERLPGIAEASRACADAFAILALDDPLAALRAAGFR